MQKKEKIVLRKVIKNCARFFKSLFKREIETVTVLHLGDKQSKLY